MTDPETSPAGPAETAIPRFKGTIYALCTDDSLSLFFGQKQLRSGVPNHVIGDPGVGAWFCEILESLGHNVKYVEENNDQS